MLKLVDVKEIKESQPAAFHETGARRYLGMNKTAFIDLVYSGVIPYTTHSNGSQRIYLRCDLDAYLESRPRIRMAKRGRSPQPALKGAAQ
jgi:hypothetical protein